MATSLAFLSVSATWADVLPPRGTPISYCFEVANLDEYPDYFLVAKIKSANPSLPDYHTILKPNLCLELNRSEEYSQVYALKRSEVNPATIVTTNQGEQIKDFNEENFHLIPASRIIYALKTLPEQYEVTQVADVLEIVGIRPDSLNLKKKEIVYTYRDGTSERRVYQRQDKRPEPSKTSVGLFLMPAIVGISVIGSLLGLKQSFLRRKHKTYN